MVVCSHQTQKISCTSLIGIEHFFFEGGEGGWGNGNNVFQFSSDHIRIILNLNLVSSNTTFLRFLRSKVHPILYKTWRFTCMPSKLSLFAWVSSSCRTVLTNKCFLCPWYTVVELSLSDNDPVISDNKPKVVYCFILCCENCVEASYSTQSTILCALSSVSIDSMLDIFADCPLRDRARWDRERFLTGKQTPNEGYHVSQLVLPWVSLHSLNNQTDTPFVYFRLNRNHWLVVYPVHSLPWSYKVWKSASLHFDRQQNISLVCLHQPSRFL